MSHIYVSHSREAGQQPFLSLCSQEFKAWHEITISSKKTQSFFFKSPFTFLGILLPQTQDGPHLFGVQVVDDGGGAEPRRVERVVQRRVHRRHVHLQRHPSTQVFVLFGHTWLGSLNISPLLSTLMRCLKCHQMQTSQVAVKMRSCQLVAVQLVLSHRPSISLWATGRRPAAYWDSDSCSADSALSSAWGRSGNPVNIRNWATARTDTRIVGTDGMISGTEIMRRQLWLTGGQKCRALQIQRSAWRKLGNPAKCKKCYTSHCPMMWWYDLA